MPPHTIVLFWSKLPPYVGTRTRLYQPGCIFCLKGGKPQPRRARLLLQQALRLPISLAFLSSFRPLVPSSSLPLRTTHASSFLATGTMVPGISPAAQPADVWHKYRYDPAIQPPHRDAVYTAKFMQEQPNRNHPLIPEHFWEIARVAGSPELPPLTDDMVRDAEQRLGVTLPTTLVEVLKSKNGGRPRMMFSLFSSFKGISGDPSKWDLVKSFRIEEWRDAAEKLQRGEPVSEWDIPPEQFQLLVPICEDDHRFCYCLDYRANGPNAEPRVTHIDVELKHDTEIAISFRALIQHFAVPALSTKPDDINLYLLVHTGLDMRSFAEVLLASVKSHGEPDDPWMQLPDIVTEVRDGDCRHVGSSQQFNIMPHQFVTGAWIQMWSCWYSEERRRLGDGTSQYVGQLVHTFPEFPEASLVLWAPNKVARRVIAVLRAGNFAQLLHPDAASLEY